MAKFVIKSEKYSTYFKEMVSGHGSANFGPLDQAHRFDTKSEAQFDLDKMGAHHGLSIVSEKSQQI